MPMKPRAVALLSGGLDSTLAVKIVLDQGIEVEAMNFTSVFCTCTPRSHSCSAGKAAAAALGVPLVVEDVSRDMIGIVKDPPHGYGSNMNPCIDCRILKFRKAAERMRLVGASFLVTGEVLNQRPMSQRRRVMRLIDREAGVEGYVLRPLSARLLEPTVPEREGMVDRSALLAVHGRSRRSQMALAAEYGISDYPCPAGGCRLTDPGFAARMRDLLAFKPDADVRDVRFLRVGRHFRLSSGSRLVVGRNEGENGLLRSLAGDGDVVFEPVNVMGPDAVARGRLRPEDFRRAAAITAAYCKGDADVPVLLRVREAGSPGTAREMTVPRMPRDEAAAMRI